jgi:GlcNAc-P-P-Und epimerase
MRVLVTGGSGFIGTNLIASLVASGVAVRNVDIAPPREPRHAELHDACDILEISQLRDTFAAFRPTHVVHLAARTDTDAGVPLYGYRANTTGTANVLAACEDCDSLKRVVVASSQFVCRPGVAVDHDETFAPHTIYGWSKVITEQLTRASRLGERWALVRPTTIWGPYSETHPARMIAVMRRGLYVHPAGEPCLRSYGYVGNVVFQIRSILSAKSARVARRVFYVGDRVGDIADWVDVFARLATGRPARRAPRPAMVALATLGDVVSRVRGTPWVIQSGRLRSMTESYVVPIERTFELAGEPPFSIEDAAKRTLEWLSQRERHVARVSSGSSE